MTPTLTWSFAAILVLLRMGLSWRWGHRFEQVLRIQEVRERFARNRRETVRLLHTGQLRPGSATFKLFFWATSFLVRRTEEYPKYVAYLFSGIRDSTDQAVRDSLTGEMQEWTPDVHALWQDFSDNLRYMALSFYPPLRWLVWLDEHFGVVRYLLSFTERAQATKPFATALEVMKNARDMPSWPEQRAAA